MEGRLIFYRKRLLGLGSCMGMAQFLNMIFGQVIKRKFGGYVGEHAGYIRNDYFHRIGEVRPNDLIIRWGCTARTENINLDQQMNTSRAITEVGMKRDFRMKCQREAEGMAPFSFDNLQAGREYFNENTTPVIVRPAKHAQGKHLYVAHNFEELNGIIARYRRHLDAGWYANVLVDKQSEFRYYVMEGRIVTVAEKTPENPEAVAWNVAQGGEFNVVKWGEWNLQGAKIAIDAMNLTSLDFGGVDVMIEKETGRAYLIEINSAPSLPTHEDGSISYRQKCMARGFLYTLKYGKGNVPPVEQYHGWRDVIHPAMWRHKHDRDEFEQDPRVKRDAA